MVKTGSILLRDLRRSMGRNFKQLISVIAISFLATCLFCGLTSNAENIAERGQLLYERTNVADIYVTGTNDIDGIENINGVEACEKRIYMPGFVDHSPVYLAITDGMPNLSKPDITEGEYGLALTNSYAKNQGVKIGDSFTIAINSNLVDIAGSSPVFRLLSYFRLPQGEDVLSLDEIPLTFTITGLMYHVEGVANSTFTPTTISLDQKLFQKAFMDLLEENYDIDRINRILTIFNTDVESLLSNTLSSFSNQVLVKADDPSSVAERLEGYFGDKATVSLVEDMSFYSGFAQEVNQAMQLTFVFPTIFFLVSLLIILTTLSQLIIRERKEIGSLKAMGVSRRQIYLHYVLYGALLVFVGSVLGFAIGPLFIPNILGIKYSILWDIPSSPVHFFYPLSLLLCLGLVLVSGLCSFLVSFSVIREKPVDTLRPKAGKTMKHVASPESFYSRHTSIPLRMAIRNVFKNKGKSLMVALGMLGCTALLVCGFGIMDTLDYDIALDDLEVSGGRAPLLRELLYRGLLLVAERGLIYHAAADGLIEKGTLDADILRKLILDDLRLPLIVHLRDSL